MEKNSAPKSSRNSQEENQKASYPQGSVFFRQSMNRLPINIKSSEGGSKPSSMRSIDTGESPTKPLATSPKKTTMRSPSQKQMLVGKSRISLIEGESPSKSSKSPTKKKMSIFIQGEKGDNTGKLVKTRTSREINSAAPERGKRRLTLKKKMMEEMEEELNVVAEDPKILLKDIKDFIKKVEPKGHEKIKLHKRGYRWIKNYIETNKKFNYNNDLKFNRYLVECCNKICTRYALKHKRFNIDRAYDILDTCTNHLDILIRFYEFYFEFVMHEKMEEKKADKPEAVSLNSSRSKYTASIEESTHSYNIKPVKVVRVTSIKDDLFGDALLNKLEQPARQRVKGYDNLETELKMTLIKKINQLNFTYEIDQYVINIIKSLMNWGYFYRKTKNYLLAHKYFHFASRYSQPLEYSSNPEIYHFALRAQASLGVFYQEANKLDESIEIFEGILQKVLLEFRVRFSDKVQSENKRKERMRLRRVVKFILTILLNLSISYQLQKNPAKVLESLRLAEWLSEQYLMPVDDVRRYITKHYRDCLKKYENFLYNLSELDEILLEFLREDYDFREKLEETANKSTLEEKLNELVFEKFHYDTLNKDKLVVGIHRPQTENYLLNYISLEQKQNPNSDFYQFFFKKLAKINPDNTRENIEDDEASEEGDPFENTSFLSKDGDNIEENGGQPMLSIKSLKADLYKIKYQDTRLNSKRYNLNFPADHKPNLMTTNMYFQPYSSKKRSSDPTIENSGKLALEKQTALYNKRVLEHIKNNFIPDQRELDEHMESLVVSNIEKNYNHKDFEKAENDFKGFLKQEEFDKKEFFNSKKLMMMKLAENITTFDPTLVEGKPHRVNVDSEIRNDLFYRRELRKFEEKIVEKRRAIYEMEKEKKSAKPTIEITNIDETGNKPKHVKNLADILVKHKEILGLKKVAAHRENMKKELESAIKVSDNENIPKKESSGNLFGNSHSSLGSKQSDQKQTMSNNNLMSPPTSFAIRKNVEKDKYFSPEERGRLTKKTRDLVALHMDQTKKEMQKIDEAALKIKTKKDHKEPDHVQEALRKYSEIANSTNLLSYSHKRQRKIIIFEDLVQAKLRSHLKEKATQAKQKALLTKFISINK